MASSQNLSYEKPATVEKFAIFGGGVESSEERMYIFFAIKTRVHGGYIRFLNFHHQLFNLHHPSSTAWRVFGSFKLKSDCKNAAKFTYVVPSTHLKNMNLPQIGMKINILRNHHSVHPF